MITREMIAEGRKNGAIKLVDGPVWEPTKECGTVCQIGEYWFFFGGQTAEVESPEEYEAHMDEKEIQEDIFSVLDSFRQDPDFRDEYELYESYLKEYVAKKMAATKNAMRIVLDDGAYMPVRAHSTDAGLDLRTPSAFTIAPNCSKVVNTGVHVELPRGTVGMLKSKSGLNINHSIVSEGVIDVGFTGPIQVKLYNRGTKLYTFNAGDKITQLVILPVVIPDSLEVVDSLEDTERGDDGFGSSGR